MTREDIIRQIVERDLNDQPLASDLVQRDAAILYAAACEYFGTWDTALQYAGVSVRRVITHQEFSPERVLQRIRKMCVNGYDMSAQRNIRRDRRFYEAARHHFGSWRRALKAAGVDLKHVRLPKGPRKLDKDQIIRDLIERHEAGLSMKCTEVCLENRALATAAMNAFHSWGRALAAAGLGPPQPEGGKKWNKEKIIAAINARHEIGKPCNYMAARKDESALVSAARRYFGNWRNALLAADVTIDVPPPHK